MHFIRKGMLAYLLFLALGQPALALDDPESVAQGQVAEKQSVMLEVANRPVFEFRASFLGDPPQARANRARVLIQQRLQEADDLSVTLLPYEDTIIVMLGGRRVFFVTPGDLDQLQHDSAQVAANVAADKLRLAIAEITETRDLSLMLKATGYSALATLVFLLLVKVIYWLSARAVEFVPGYMHSLARSFKSKQAHVVGAKHLYPVMSRIGRLLRWSVLLLLTYEWLSFVLSRFPYTRPWGELLNTYLLDFVSYLFDAIVGAIPGLGVAVAIYFIAVSVNRFFLRLLKVLAAPANVTSWLNQETLPTTTRLASLAIWLFALAMAYPYLPGAETEAFKGLSVLLGLMVSLGASGVIGQAISGLILTYTHTLRLGEYVSIGEHEGTVTEMGVFTTRIRTGLGEVLSIPNAMITGAVTKNYSRTVQGEGYMVSTTVTIGYDTPWRQVEAMLIEAACRTEGVVSEPLPVVFQTALSDFYPEYRLVAQAIPSQPRPRGVLLSMLHANIQDVFNEYAVQIMSPHYEKDPQQPKVVAKADWYQAPAEKP